ncbi:aminodeoxychorismate/anthranilate synthase component II [Candidatus Peregrinibacteria bacterium]|nr:aminodeoxychorismate/anthranilate synthase component II [Candidatus Peregrinibacteria bacterium]
MKTLIIDNFDSFTYNLYQYCAELGGNPIVCRNNEITIKDIEKNTFTHIIISPGPGTPEKNFGICKKVIEVFTGRIPILGVCLGHQGIIFHFGGRIIRAPKPVHGKQSTVKLKITHPLFHGLPEKIKVMRYHSLIGEKKSLPKELEIIAETDGLIMGISHKFADVFGVQFHPESIGTLHGKKILKNFFSIDSHKKKS